MPAWLIEHLPLVKGPPHRIVSRGGGIPAQLELYQPRRCSRAFDDIIEIFKATTAVFFSLG